MPRAQGSREELAYIEEVTPGVTPAGTWNAIRKNSNSLAGTFETVESGEIRADRQSSSDIQGNKNVGGDIASELSPDSHDALIAGAMFDTWTTVDSGLLDLDIASNVISRASGSFVTDGFIVGQWVELTGFTDPANNTWGKISAVTALTMTIVGVTLVDELGTADEQIRSKYVIGSTTPTYFSISKRFRDIDREVVMAGCLMDVMALTMAPNAPMGLNFTVNGMNETVNGSAPAVADDVSTSDPYTSFSGAVLLDDVVNSNMTAFDLSLANNLADGFVIGSQFKVAQFAGRQLPTGNVSFYFEDLDEYNDSLAHTAKNIAMSAYDAGVGGYFGITLPRTYIDLATPAAGDEGPMVLQGAWRAKLDATLGSSIIISASINA